MRILCSHSTGNRNVRAVLAALHGQGMLAGFHTAFAVNPTAGWLRILPERLGRDLLRRTYEVPDGLISQRPLREIVRTASMRLGWARFFAHEKGWACVDAVWRDLDLSVARSLSQDASGESINAVYAYEDGALATFTRAKELGIARVYDLPIAYWETGRRLMTDDAERLPSWAATLGGGVKDSPAKLARKTRELELADLVITPSQFVADSLPEWARASKRVIVAPFGSPPATQARDGTAAPVASGKQLETSSSKLRVLFAGSMGQRKGLGDLFAAMRLLKRADVELVVMGSLQAPMEFYRSEYADFTYEQGRPHAQVLELMRSCDVFCLPSIVEGRALVMQEAMSQGLPIIITPNTGGADLVEPNQKPETGRSREAEMVAPSGRGPGATAERANEPGALGAGEEANLKPEFSDPSSLRLHPSSRFGKSATGFLVPIRSPEAIAEAIAWCADHRAETAEMGRAARRKATTYTWESYGETVVAAIRRLIVETGNRT